MDALLCRTCRKSYTPAEVKGRRACPKCRGPLISAVQMEQYKAETQASLDTLRRQSAITLTLGAGIAVGIHLVISALKESRDFDELTYVIVAGGLASMAATAVWWRRGTQSAMLLASLVFQLTACFYFFSAFAASMPPLELADKVPGKLGDYLRIVVFLVAISPLGLSLVAWHQYASFVTVKKRSASTGV